VVACELSHHKQLLFIENVMGLLQRGTYRAYGTNVELYNFFANISALTWATRFNQLKSIKVRYFALNIYTVFARVDEDEDSIKQTFALCEGILRKNRDDDMTMEEYNALRFEVGPDPYSMIEAHYIPFTREEFEGGFSTTGFAKDLVQLGKKRKIELIDFFYPEPVAQPLAEPMTEEAFENALGEVVEP
jgi:hypothetical protein